MNGHKQKNILERALGLFSEVKAGEGTTVLLMTTVSFLILSSYYFLKPVREALILSMKGGAELKTYASVGQGLLLIVTVQVYSWLGSRMGRRALINSVTLFFVACLIVFYFLGKAHFNLGLTFFLWVGIFNLIVVSQFYSFANDIYTVEEGQRLFPIVVFGSSLGAVVGSYVADQLLGPVGIYELLLIGNAILILSLLITNYVDSREKERMKEVAAIKAEEAVEKPLGKEGGFQLVFKNKYLLLIALMILFLNPVKTTGEYLLSRSVAENASKLVAEDALGMA
jgi:AAA family ATP:ADP antiporter